MGIAPGPELLFGSRPTLGDKLLAYLWHLPRWFGLPAATLSVVMGGLVAGTEVLPMALAALSAGLVMAFAHTWNSFHDYASGLDQGPESERSRPKPYTSGQNLIAWGVVTPGDTFVVAVFYLGLSALATAVLADQTTWWVFLPWAIAAACAPLYSWGKFWYSCELWLTVGFGPAAAMLGAASAPSHALWNAALASLPLGLLFGYGAEVVDQYLDAENNVPKGLRNIGALVWKTKSNLFLPMLFILGLVLILQAVLMAAGVLAYATWPAIFPLAVIVFLVPAMQRNDNIAIMLGLGLVFAYGFVAVVLQALA